jgi:hypothetical protein
VESVTSEEKMLELRRVSNKQHLVATLWSAGAQKEVSDWIGIGSSVSNVTSIMEYVLAGKRKCRSSSAKNSRNVHQDVEMHRGVTPMYCTRPGTANLSRRVFSADKKSVSENCLLHKVSR